MQFSLPIGISTRDIHFRTRTGQCTFKINQIKRLFEIPLNIHSKKIISYNGEIEFRNHNRCNVR